MRVMTFKRITLTHSNLVQGHTPNITEIDDPRDFVNMYRRSAILAKRAGFDCIELLAQG